MSTGFFKSFGLGKLLSALALIVIAGPLAAQITVKPIVGDPEAIAKRVVLRDHDNCKRVSTAIRLNDGSILATCQNGERFRVFDLGGNEVAMSCTAAKKYGVEGC